MKKFLQLNRHKLRFIFIVVSIVFLGLASIILLIGYFNGSMPETWLTVIILLTAGVGFPFFIIGIAFLAWLHKRWARRKAFSTPPFDELQTLGFHTTLLNEHTKMHLTEEILSGNLNGYLMLFDLYRDKYHVIELKIFSEWKQFDGNEYKMLDQRFREYKMELDMGYFSKKYNIKQLNMSSIDELKNDLLNLCDIIKRAGFKPVTLNSNVRA